jgi:hypothetical protein
MKTISGNCENNCPDRLTVLPTLLFYDDPVGSRGVQPVIKAVKKLSLRLAVATGAPFTPAWIIKPQPGEKQVSAIELATAAGLAAVFEIFADGGLQQGFIKQEEIALEAFFATKREGRIHHPDFDPASVASLSFTSSAFELPCMPAPFKMVPFEFLAPSAAPVLSGIRITLYFRAVYQYIT